MFRLNARIVIFSAAAALLSVVLFGLVPAFQTTRADLSSALKGSSAVPPRRRWFFSRLWGRNLLVAGQVAISVLLLAVSTITYVGIRGFLDIIRDQGYPAEHVLSVTFDTLVTHYKDAQAQQFYTQMMERLRSAAGIKSVTLASSAEQMPAWPEGYQASAGAAAGTEAGHDNLSFNVIWADENFFDALAIPLLQGRGFRTADSASAPAIAVVNESLAKRYWAGQDPVGKRMRFGDPGSKTRWVEIVGVASIKNYQGIVSVPPPDLVFFPAAQNPKHPVMTLFAQATGDPTALIGLLRATVREVDPQQAVPDVHRWQEVYEIIRKSARLITEVIGAMGAMGMGLSLVGLYGLVAYDVSTRTREIGIRMALGAARGSVLRMVLRQGLVLSVCGIAAGLLLNYGAGRLLLSLFHANVNPAGGGVEVNFGYPSIAVFVLVVLALTMLAAYIPARRAARVDPNEALRCE